MVLRGSFKDYVKPVLLRWDVQVAPMLQPLAFSLDLTIAN